ncbi:hypothetical protein B0T17DRAFT_324558 [Bombardia bombarda]|uniref:Uncharacterized protein n=1 Tax=Bombardia bombarda TaxID=252184 RepID=A0AA39WMG8_9PEZI|nr:hypothetical protein B0T17DRAFT_324558 [Bombardia bombarda]
MLPSTADIEFAKRESRTWREPFKLSRLPHQVLDGNRLSSNSFSCLWQPSCMAAMHADTNAPLHPTWYSSQTRPHDPMRAGANIDADDGAFEERKARLSLRHTRIPTPGQEETATAFCFSFLSCKLHLRASARTHARPSSTPSCSSQLLLLLLLIRARSLTLVRSPFVRRVCFDPTNVRLQLVLPLFILQRYHVGTMLLPYLEQKDTPNPLPEC